MVAPAVYPLAIWATNQAIAFAKSPAGRELGRKVGGWFATQLQTPAGRKVVGEVAAAGTRAAAGGLRSAGVPVPPAVEQVVSAGVKFGAMHHYSGAAQHVPPPYESQGPATGVPGLGGHHSGGTDNQGGQAPPPQPWSQPQPPGR